MNTFDKVSSRILAEHYNDYHSSNLDYRTRAWLIAICEEIDEVKRELNGKD